LANTFLISDTHFGHQGICTFLKDDGTKVRPWSNAIEMDEKLIENWNKTVRPNDKIYHLGDIAIKRHSLEVLKQLNGDKVLIRGNHDIFKLKDYTKYFRDIRGTCKFDCFLFSHYPVHIESIGGHIKCNVHGHLHYRHVLDENNNIHKNYENVSVECIEYTPISFEQMKQNFKARS